MADETRIINGSFKGVPVSITGASVDGGPRLSIKLFPNRDTQSIENMGLTPRSYTLDINVYARAGQGYFSYRDQIIAALESGGPGVLIHPLYGRLEDMVNGPYSLNERFTNFGESTITVTFSPDSNVGIPQTAGSAVTNVQASTSLISQAAEKDVAAGFSVDPRNPGNFGAASDKITDTLLQMVVSASFMGEAADTPDQFTAEIERLLREAPELVTNPALLGEELAGIFSTLEALYESPEPTLGSFLGLFGFGADDPEIKATTVGLQERATNSGVLNGTVAALSLGHAYLAASQLEFTTTQEIDEVAAQLDGQFAAVQGSESSQAVKDAVTDTRIVVLGLFDGARVSTSQILEVTTGPTTVRLLTFAYYGNDDLGETLAELNGISDVSFVEGPVEVLTA